MEYKGKLYGKAGEIFFPLIMTSDDVDALMKEPCVKGLLMDFIQWQNRCSKWVTIPEHMVDDFIKWRKSIKTLPGKYKVIKCESWCEDCKAFDWGVCKDKYVDNDTES